jgi:predicted HTH domain antitoxin
MHIKEKGGTMTQIQTTVGTDSLTFILPHDIPLKCQEHHIDLPTDMKRYIAVILYQNSVVSIGKAAQLAGMDRIAFEYYLANNKIPISNLSFEDVMRDAAQVKEDAQIQCNRAF